jgi:hypothetical protein
LIFDFFWVPFCLINVLHLQALKVAATSSTTSVVPVMAVAAVSKQDQADVSAQILLKKCRYLI